MKTANLLFSIALQSALSTIMSLFPNVPFSPPRNETHYEQLWEYSIKLLRKFIDDDCASKLTDMGLTISSSSEAAASPGDEDD